MGFIDRPQTVTWRKALFQIHLWVGVIVGLYMVLISVTGSILVYQRDIENNAPLLGNDRNTQVSSFDPIVAVAQRAHPGEPLDNIDLRTLDRRVVPVGLRVGERERVVYVDSVTRQIVGEHILQERHNVTQLMMALHNQLAAGLTGGYINGIGGALLFLMSLTGVVLWWPGRKNWKRALKVKWDARFARLNWDLHSAFGFWTLLLIAMWGITGAYFIFPQPFRDALAKISPMPHFDEKVSTWQPGQAIQNPDAYIQKAQQLYPESKLAYLYMSTGHPNGVVKVFLSRNPERPLVMLEDVVSFHPATLEILSDISTSKMTVGETVSLALYSIHFGDFGGAAVKFLWFVLGLVPGVLTVTGFIMWWNRVLKKKWRALRSYQPARTPAIATDRSR